MKKTLAASFLYLTSAAAFAQGYAGVVAALSSIDAGCNNQLSCDKKGRAFKLYAGANLAKDKQIDFGIGRLQAIEVSVIGFGKASSNGTTILFNPDFVPSDPAAQITAATSQSRTANALTLAGVAKFPIMEDMAFVARGGVAYVSSTVRYYVQGGQNGSETSTKLKPYLGVGFEFEAVKGLRVVGSFDWTKFDVVDQKGGLKALGVGAEVTF